jgi:hypothetical protein
LCPERLRTAPVDTDPVVKMGKIRGAGMTASDRLGQQRQVASAILRRRVLNQLPASVGAIGADQVRPQPTMAGEKRHQHLEVGLVDIDDPLPGRSVRARPLFGAGLPRVPVRASSGSVTTCAVQYGPPQDAP